MDYILLYIALKGRELNRVFGYVRNFRVSHLVFARQGRGCRRSRFGGATEALTIQDAGALM